MTAKARPHSILVVEDSDEDFAAMERILRRAGVSVGLNRCTGADQTLDWFETLQGQPTETTQFPALVVLDLNLPGRDGRYVLRGLRRQPALRDIPVVIFSTSNEPEDIAWCYENGANSYYVKDVDYQKFKRAVEDLSSVWLKSPPPPANSETWSAS